MLWLDRRTLPNCNSQLGVARRHVGHLSFGSSVSALNVGLNEKPYKAPPHRPSNLLAGVLEIIFELKKVQMNNYFITLQKLSKTFVLVVFKPQPTKQLIYSCERVLKKQLKTGRLVDTSSISLDWMLSKSLTLARLLANVCIEASSQMLIL